MTTDPTTVPRAGKAYVVILDCDEAPIALEDRLQAIKGRAENLDDKTIFGIATSMPSFRQRLFRAEA